MPFRDDTTGDAQGGFTKNEDYKKIIPSSQSGIEIPEIGQGRLYFRLLNAAPEAFGHYMEFWLNLGVNSQTQRALLIPKVSPNPFTDFIAVGRDGKKYVGRTAAAAGCPLSRLADARHPLIALNTLKKDREGNFKPNVDPCHVTPVQLVEPVKGPDGVVIIENGVPKVKVHPEMYLFKFRQGWWDSFLDIIEPKPQGAATVDDGMTEAPKVVVKTLPTKDLTKVVFFIERKKRVLNATGNPKMDVDYVVSFSEKIVLTPEMIPAPVGAVDFHSVMQAPSDQELAALAIKAEVRAGMRPAEAQAPAHQGGTPPPSPDKAGTWGEKVPRPAAAGASTGAPSATLTLEEKEPF